MDLDYIYHPEKVAADAWIAPSANVCGQVLIGARSSVWFGAVIRGDNEAIELGEDVNIQDGAILHADAGVPCRLGNRVTVGHGAIVHGAVVGDDCLVGIRATILNRVVVGAGSLIAAGALVPEGTEIPPGSVVMGVPAKVVRQVTDKDASRMSHAWQHYREASQQARRQLSPKTTPT